MNPLLLTPGPLTTAKSTREAMLVDYGSRDPAFVAMVTEMRKRVVALIASEPEYSCVPLQGSGTFAVEAMFGTLVPRDGKVLVLINGAYGQRIAQILKVQGRESVCLDFGESAVPDLPSIERALANDAGITHVAVVYCETTTGILNPVQAIAELVAHHGRKLLIDAMSAFGALPLRAETVPFEAVAASSNKCLEGVPGMGFVIAKTATLRESAGRSASLSLDLHDSWKRFEKDGQWRFTPPTHVIASFNEALRLHTAEGGVEGRGSRYRTNHTILVSGMRKLGFKTMLPDVQQAPIITTFLEPADPTYQFEAFYDALRENGFAIYPGKLTEANTFRIGCIGQVYPADIERFLEVVQAVMMQMGIRSGAPANGGF